MTPKPRVRTGGVALVGNGVVARAALHTLLQGGVDDVSVDDWGSLGPAAAIQNGVGGLPAAWPPHNGPRSAPRICLLCADVVDAGDVLELNRRCLKRRTKLIPGIIMGSVGQVGPVVVAGRGACLHCVDLRLRSTTGRSCLVPYGPPDPLIAALVGRELASRALALLAGEAPDPYLAHHWPDGSVTRHRVLRTWHCPDCAGLGPSPGFIGPGGVQLDDSRFPARDILDLEAELVDPVTGPIRSLERFRPEEDDPPLHHWVAALADPGWAQIGLATIPCGGHGLDGDAARAAALGEAAERMSACQPEPTDLLVAPYEEVRMHALDPRAWDLFDEATRSQPGFPYAEVAPEDDLSWSWGWSLTRGCPVLVTAARVFVPFRPRTAADSADDPTLSGFAAGTTLVSATVAALLEVVERDAFMIAWANRLRLPRLELTRTSPHGVGDYIAVFEDRDVEVRCFLLMLDLGAPTVLAMARRSRPGDPAVVVATAADLDLAAACRHALAELAANRLVVRHAMSSPRPPANGDGRRVADGTGNGRIYADPVMAAHLDFWWDSDTTVPLTSLDRPLPPDVALRRIVAATSAAGLETAAIEITPPELHRLGLAVVKALVPGTYQLTLDERWPHFGGHRLRTAPVTAGLLDSPLPAASLNRLPHPFP